MATPAKFASQAKLPLTAIGEFNIAFCDSRKYRNPKGIISHFALAKYFTDNFSHHPFGWCFFGFLGALHQEPVIINPPFYRLSVAKEVGSDPTAAGGGRREGSEWQRSVCNASAPSARRIQGTATVHCMRYIIYRCIVRAITIGSSPTGGAKK